MKISLSLIITFLFLQLSVYSQVLHIDTLIINYAGTNAKGYMKAYTLQDSSRELTTQFTKGHYNIIVYDNSIIYFENISYYVKPLGSKQKPIRYAYPDMKMVIGNVTKENDKILLLDYSNNKIHIAKLNRNKQLIIDKSIPVGEEADMPYLCENGKTIFVTYTNGIIERINVATNKRTRFQCMKFEDNLDHYVTSMKQSPDKSMLSLVYFDHLLCLIDMNTDSVIYKDFSFGGSNSLFFDEHSESFFYPNTFSVVKYSISKNDTTHYKIIEKIKSNEGNQPDKNSLIEVHNIFSNQEYSSVRNRFVIDDLDIMNDTVYYVSTNANTQHIHSFSIVNAQKITKSENLFKPKNMNLRNYGKPIDKLISNESKKLNHLIIHSGADIAFDKNNKFIWYFYNPADSNRVSLLSSKGNFIFHASDYIKFYDKAKNDSVEGVLFLFNPLDKSISDKYFFSRKGTWTRGIPYETSYPFTTAFLSNNDKNAYMVLEDRLIKFNVIKGQIEDSTRTTYPIAHIKNDYSQNKYLVVTKNNEFGFVKEKEIGRLLNVIYKAKEEVLDVQLDDKSQYVIVQYKQKIVVYDYDFKQAYLTPILDSIPFLGFKFYKGKLVLFYSDNEEEIKGNRSSRILNEYYYDSSNDCLYLINESDEVTKYNEVVRKSD